MAETVSTTENVATSSSGGWDLLLGGLANFGGTYGATLLARENLKTQSLINQFQSPQAQTVSPVVQQVASDNRTEETMNVAWIIAGSALAALLLLLIFMKLK